MENNQLSAELDVQKKSLPVKVVLARRALFPGSCYVPHGRDMLLRSNWMAHHVTNTTVST